MVGNKVHAQDESRIQFFECFELLGNNFYILEGQVKIVVTDGFQDSVWFRSDLCEVQYLMAIILIILFKC